MRTNKTYSIHFKQNNLIGNIQHKQFLELQATFGVAQRGGSQLPSLSEAHDSRLVSNINLLDKIETRKLIFSETIISN